VLAGGTAAGLAPLRSPPERATSPLPGSFRLSTDPSTIFFEDGSVLMGGSPLRLFRLSGRAQEVVARWRGGGAVGERGSAQRLARRLVSAGALLPVPGSPTHTTDDVAVVVPVQDRPRQLDRLLGSLGDLSCIVVDDASTDAAAVKDTAERHGAQFVALGSNVGPAAARNAGLAVAQTSLVAFVDSDCAARPGWLEPLLGHFNDPLVAVVAPRIVPAVPAAPGWVSQYESVRSSLDRGRTAGLVRPLGPIPYVPSAALVVRRAVADGAHLFDPDLRGGEDVDLVWRLAAAGWDVRYEPAAVVEHDGPTTAEAFVSKRYFYGTTAAPLSRRHPDAMAPLHASAWSLAVWLSALARRPFAALAALVTPVAILARRLRGLVRNPVAVAARIVAGGTVRGALPALRGVVRAWSPLLVLGLTSRRSRRAAASAFLLAALDDWAHNPGDLDLVSYAALHVADDVAYGLGVWAGCARERTMLPLIPRLAWRSRVWSSGALRDSLGPPVGDS
jgi:mycofactocin system glycosyltransferase